MQKFKIDKKITETGIHVTSYNFDGYKPKDIAVDIVTSIASVCYQSNSAGSERLYNMLAEENHNLPSSAFEFIPVVFDLDIRHFIAKAIRKNIPCNIYKYGYKYNNSWITNLRALWYDYKNGIITKYIYDTTMNNVIFGSENRYFIENINMYTFGQLVRTREASFQVKSRRYVSDKKSPFSFNTEASNLPEIANDLCMQQVEIYNSLIQNGDKKEVARGVIPQFATTELWFGFNSTLSRENFMNIRLPKKAQREIRGLAEVLNTI